MKNTKIIINADDYGLNEHNSKAIAQAFKEGKINSATMMANGEYFTEAILLAKENHFIDKIGIHFNLDEGKPLSKNIQQYSSLCKDGYFLPRFNRRRIYSRKERKAIYEELSSQLERLENAGVKITHADSHHHVHNNLIILNLVLKLLKKHHIHRLRIHRNIGDIPLYKRPGKWLYNLYLLLLGYRKSKYFGSLFDIQKSGLKDNSEIMVHPDFNQEGILIDRVDEVDHQPIGEPLPNLLKENASL